MKASHKQPAEAIERAELVEAQRQRAMGKAEDKFAEYYRFMSAGADTEFCQFWRETSTQTLTLLEDGRYLERMTTAQAAAFFAAGQPHVIYVRASDGPLVEVLQGEMIFPDTQPMRFSRCRMGAVVE